MQLSYSSLSVMKDCERCFYLDRNLKISRPEGIKSGMPNSVDGILKERLEGYRGALPPQLSDYPELNGFVLYNDPEMAKMRHWKSNPLRMEDAKGNIIVGGFDDLLYNPTTEVFAYLDYKTTGKEPDQDFGEKYYQSQCDIYTRFLEVAKRKIAKFGVLLFFWPAITNGKSLNGLVEFKSKAIFLKPNPAQAEKTFKEAILLLEKKETPVASVGCKYCGFVKQHGGVK